jgi:hypothetical protein
MQPTFNLIFSDHKCVCLCSCVCACVCLCACSRVSMHVPVCRSVYLYAFVLQVRVSKEDQDMMIEEASGAALSPGRRGEVVDLPTFLTIMENATWY